MPLKITPATDVITGQRDMMLMAMLLLLVELKADTR